MNPRMLNDVQRRQMKSESTYATHEPAHQEISGMASPILKQTLGDHPNIRQQLIGILVRVGPPLVTRLEPLAYLPEEHAVWHPIVPCGGERLCPRQHARVGLDALGKGGAYADPIRTLAQGLGQLL